MQSFRLLGSVPPFLATTCHIPKPNQPGQWRLIVDLSAPAGASVNDAIHPDLCSLCYASLDDVTLVVQKPGRGAVLAKLDLKKAYRMVPVHPDVWSGVPRALMLLPTLHLLLGQLRSDVLHTQIVSSPADQYLSGHKVLRL